MTEKESDTTERKLFNFDEQPNAEQEESPDGQQAVDFAESAEVEPPSAEVEAPRAEVEAPIADAEATADVEAEGAEAVEAAAEVAEGESSDALADASAAPEAGAEEEVASMAGAPEGQLPDAAGESAFQAVPEPAAQKPGGGLSPVVIGAIGAVAALLIGLLIGAFACHGPAGGGNLSGKTTVTESELGSDIAAYTVDGKTEKITVKEAIEQTNTLEGAKNPDGTYNIPAADAVMSVARNRVIVSAAQSKGITVSDEELADFAEQQFGTSDFASVASSYGMDEATVKKLLSESCLMEKLRESVMGDTDKSTEAMPEPPSQPANSASAENTSAENQSGTASSDGTVSEENTGSTASSQTVSKEYADYIIALAGDEWDKSKGTWASKDGPYYQALSSYEITPDGATYEAATAAYYVAYEAYSESASATSELWTNYLNEQLSKASISIYTMLT